MNFSDRMRAIIEECGLRQKDFAKSINVTDSYISKILRDESGMSNSTAMLIEQLYGYSKNWIMTGREPKITTGRDNNLTAMQKRIIFEVERMDEGELKALYAFIESLKKINVSSMPQKPKPKRQ